MDDYTREARCDVCRLTPGLCVCDELPRLPCPVEVVLVRHAKEDFSQSNTGALVHRLLERSRLMRYARGEQPFDGAALVAPGAHVLFPRPGAPVLSPALADEVRSLIVFDAKWRQARRMSTRIEEVRTLPFVALPAGTTPRWVLRRPREPGHVSTIEAVANALQSLGHADCAAEMWRVLEHVMPRMLHVASKRRRG